MMPRTRLFLHQDSSTSFSDSMPFLRALRCLLFQFKPNLTEGNKGNEGDCGVEMIEVVHHNELARLSRNVVSAEAGCDVNGELGEKESHVGIEGGS